MIARSVLAKLVVAGCVLPLVLAVVVGVARLLTAMQDLDGARVLDRIALGVAILWGVNLVCLLLALGVNALGPPEK